MEMSERHHGLSSASKSEQPAPKSGCTRCYGYPARANGGPGLTQRRAHIMSFDLAAKAVGLARAALLPAALALSLGATPLLAQTPEQPATEQAAPSPDTVL